MLTGFVCIMNNLTIWLWFTSFKFKVTANYYIIIVAHQTRCTVYHNLDKEKRKNKIIKWKLVIIKNLLSQNLNCLLKIFQRKAPLCAMTEERLRLGIFDVRRHPEGRSGFKHAPDSRSSGKPHPHRSQCVLKPGQTAVSLPLLE